MISIQGIMGTGTGQSGEATGSLGASGNLSPHALNTASHGSV